LDMYNKCNAACLSGVLAKMKAFWLPAIVLRVSVQDVRTSNPARARAPVVPPQKV